MKFNVGSTVRINSSNVIGEIVSLHAIMNYSENTYVVRVDLSDQLSRNYIMYEDQLAKIESVKRVINRLKTL